MQNKFTSLSLRGRKENRIILSVVNRERQIKSNDGDGGIWTTDTVITRG